MNKQIILTASVFGLIAVVLGAFGAHGLKDRLNPTDLDVWKTGVSYQFYHVLALLFLASSLQLNVDYSRYSFYCFVTGIIFFSGSLYLLSTRSLTGWSRLSVLGPVTPIGGLFFLLGWLFLFLAAFKGR